jgi:predicted signal transduction protein with EAL and GGDEF domain
LTSLAVFRRRQFDQANFWGCRSSHGVERISHGQAEIRTPGQSGTGHHRHAVFSSCSVGVVGADSQFHEEPADLLRDADTAMYRVKHGGRDSYSLFSREVRREVSDQMEQESALRNALKRSDELMPYFQPIVDVKSGATVALEALIGWRHIDTRPVSAGDRRPAVDRPIG